MSRCIFRLLLIAAIAVCCVQCSAGVVLKPNGGSAMPMFMRTLSADVEINGQIADTKLVMTFQNEDPSQFEADFIYALPPGGIPTYFAYWANDEKVVAKVVEKKEAAKVYRTIVNLNPVIMHDPALVELLGKSTFRARIYPVLPDQDLKVEVHIVQILPSEGSAMVYSLPIFDPLQPDPYDKIDVHIKVHPGPGVSDVTNNLGLPVDRSRGDDEINLTGREYKPRKDLNIRISRRIMTMLSTGGGCFALSFTPDHTLANPRVTIQGKGVRVSEIAPAHIQSVKAGRELTVFGRFRGSGTALVILSGKGPKGPLCYSTTLYFKDGAADAPAKLWAWHRMDDLAAKPTNKQAVMHLSKEYGMPSRYTSWLAVPKAEMINYYHEKYKKELSEIVPPLAKIISGETVKGHSEEELRGKLRALCRTIGTTLRDELGDSLREIVNEMAPIAAKAMVDGKETPQSKVAKARIARIGRELGQSPEALMDYTLQYEAQKAAVQLLASGQDDTPRYREIERLYYASGGQSLYAGNVYLKQVRDTDIQELLNEEHEDNPNQSTLAGLRARISRLSDASGENSEAAIKRVREQSKPVDGYQIGYTLGELVKKGKGDSRYARELKQKIESYRNGADGYLNPSQGALVSAAQGVADQIAEATAKGDLAGVTELKKQVEELARLSDKDPNVLLKDDARQRMNNLAQQIILSDGRLVATRNAREQMDRLQSLADQTTAGALEQARGELRRTRLSYQTGDVAVQLVDEIAAGKEHSKSAVELRKKLDSLCRSTGENPDKLLQSELTNETWYLTWELSGEFKKNPPNRKTVAKLEGSLKRLEHAGGGDGQDPIRKARFLAADEVAASSAELVVNEANRPNLNLPRLHRLVESFGSAVDRVKSASEPKYNSDIVDTYLSAMEESHSVEKLAKEVTGARQAGDRAKLAKLATDLEQASFGFGYTVRRRYGDPLISIDAPADARQVVALMPDGQIKPLEYNTGTKRWEARFDIPAYVPEGDYAVNVVAMLKDGSRKMIGLHFMVDLTAPRGVGSASEVAGQKLRLEIEADKDTRRVTAVLPWGDKIELDRSGTTGRFFATVQVPAGQGNPSGAVSFILTDSAHNRSIVTVEETGE